MDGTARAYAQLAHACTTAEDADELLAGGVRLVRELAAAQAVAVLRKSGDSDVVIAQDGTELDAQPRVSRQLPGVLGTLVVAAPADEDGVATAVDVLFGGVGRLEAESRFADLTTRVDGAQQLANMGDYDWHIASDTNRWSDQLYRIYGHEPQSFNASYERFLAHIHPEDRERIQAIHQRAYATGEPYQMIERIVRPTGEVRYLSSNGQVLHDESGTPVRMRGTCIDITDRVLAEQEREEAAATLRETQVRRRQALEINDNVVQGLSAAIYSLAAGDADASASYLEGTLAAARKLMNDWLEPLDGQGVRPGDLVRDRAATLDVQPAALDVSSDAAADHPRVLIVDDFRDVRALLRMQLEAGGTYEVVGEAGDGVEAVELAAQLQPDVVLLDLAMPRMDGLQALPLIRDAVHGVRVIVLSGFDQGSMAQKALDAGADRYVEKGLRMNLAQVIQGVISAA